MTWEYLIFASGFLSFHDTRGNLAQKRSKRAKTCEMSVQF